MGHFSARALTLCSFLSARALTLCSVLCGLSCQEQQETPTPASLSRIASVTQRNDSPLPAFINGGLRCQNTGNSASDLTQDSKAEGTPPLITREVFQLAQKESQEVRCSGPKAWCFFFGPSEQDRENQRLRRQIQVTRERNLSQTRDLEARLLKAQQESTRQGGSERAEVRSPNGAGIYLTNDDSMSLASPQRLLFAIERKQRIARDQVRPHELLNYFDFEAPAVEEGQTFSVRLDLATHPVRETDVTLGFSVRGRQATRENRRNLNLAVVVDRSASMGKPGRMELAQEGILRSLSELKSGDILHVILFDSVTCPLVQNFVVGRDSISELTRLIRGIEPLGGSNLRDGLGQGYVAVNRLYQPTYENRVLLITDAHASLDKQEDDLAALSARQHDARQIRLSVVGLGDVSDSLMDRLTEAGKGASMYLSSSEGVGRTFGSEFTSLVETVATNVHFRVDLPESLTLRAFYGEEASREKGAVKSLHYFSGTGQMYLANLVGRDAFSPDDEIRLTIEFDDPTTGEPRTEQHAWTGRQLGLVRQGELPVSSGNLEKARMVATFGYQLRHMAQAYEGRMTAQKGPDWFLSVVSDQEKEQRSLREQAVLHCGRVQGRLDAFSASLRGEPDANHLVQLWRKYCRRYEQELPSSVSPELKSPRLVEATEVLLPPGAEEELSRKNEYPPLTFDL